MIEYLLILVSFCSPLKKVAWGFQNEGASFHNSLREYVANLMLFHSKTLYRCEVSYYHMLKLAIFVLDHNCQIGDLDSDLKLINDCFSPLLNQCQGNIE